MSSTDQPRTHDPGRLILAPNTLDHAHPEPVSIELVLPREVIARMAGLRHWAVENAKSARALLKRVDAVVPLGVPMQSIAMVELPRPPKGGDAAAQGNEWRALLQPALAGHDLGLLSEAGLPALADPGARLVALAHDSGVTVEVLPGVSSIALAVAASGLNGQSFAFVGYVPQQEPERAQRLRALEQLSRQQAQTQVVIETPYRNEALWAALVKSLAPTTRLSIACGLTLPGGFCQTRDVARWRREPPSFPANMPTVFAWLAQT